MQGNLCHISIIHLKGTRCLYVGPGVDPWILYILETEKFFSTFYHFLISYLFPENLNAMKPEEGTCSNGQSINNIKLDFRLFFTSLRYYFVVCIQVEEFA